MEELDEDMRIIQENMRNMKKACVLEPADRWDNVMTGRVQQTRASSCVLKQASLH